VKRLAREKLLCDLTLELETVGACLAMGFHPSKARLPGQLLSSIRFSPRGPTPAVD
jgi:hypothetical protein